MHSWKEEKWEFKDAFVAENGQNKAKTEIRNTPSIKHHNLMCI